MGLLVYDINNYTKENLPPPFTGIDIYPMVGYSDSEPPFILYFWQPSKRNIERYYIRRDYIVYNIYDTDAERLFTLTDELEKLFNLGDNIQGRVSSSTNRVLWSDWRGAMSTAPTYREGFYKMAFEIWIGYVPLSNPIEIGQVGELNINP